MVINSTGRRSKRFETGGGVLEAPNGARHDARMLESSLFPMTEGLVK